MCGFLRQGHLNVEDEYLSGSESNTWVEAGACSVNIAQSF